MLFFFAPALLYPSGHALRETAHWETLGHQFGFDVAGDKPAIHPNGYFYGYLAVVYLVSMFLATFFHAAFYNEILKALAGSPVSVRAGLAFAWSRVHSILMWSLLAGTVGLLIKALEERLGWIGRWVMRFVGGRVERSLDFRHPGHHPGGHHQPVLLLRQSAGILRKTWGESLVGYVGITVGRGSCSSARSFSSAAPSALAVMARSPLVIGAASCCGWARWFSSVTWPPSPATSTVAPCTSTPSEGVVPAPYTPALMDAAWKIKKA
ncbi:MAG: DUF6159 family protein [Lacunisphaera sp.]